MPGKSDHAERRTRDNIPVGEGYIRISYAYSIDDLKVAIRRLSAFINRLRG